MAILSSILRGGAENGTYYSSVVSTNGNTPQGSADAATLTRVPRNGTLKNLVAKVKTASGVIDTNATIAFTILMNANATSLGVTLTDAHDVEGITISDTTNTVTVVAGDDIRFQVVIAGAGGNVIANANLYVLTTLELE